MATIIRRMGSLANRLLRLVDVRAVRSSSYDTLQQERESASRLRDHLEANAREREKLQHLLEDARTNGEKVSEMFRSLHKKIERSLLVPIGHIDRSLVVQRRPDCYQFAEVIRCFERHLPEIEQFLAGLFPLMYGPDLERVARDKVSDTEPYWNNGYFSGDDARVAYAVAAKYQPRTIIEIGSGNSTKFFRKAIKDHQLNTKICCIDPEPRADVTAVADRIVFQSVLDVPLSFFQSLQAGDILFLDGSHLVFNGTDAVYFFLEILPSLTPGVFVQIHDIMLPFEYNQEFSERQYNEQYLLAMLLLYSNEWVPLAPLYYLDRLGLVKEGGVSFWLKRETRKSEVGPLPL